MLGPFTIAGGTGSGQLSPPKITEHLPPRCPEFHPIRGRALYQGEDRVGSGEGDGHQPLLGSYHVYLHLPTSTALVVREGVRSPRWLPYSEITIQI